MGGRSASQKAEAMKILPGVTSDALFSDCKRFRYWLTRTWSADFPTIAFIGLNPSVASLEVDDKTVRKCQMYARRWGYGRLLMLNLYAFRETDPKVMWRALDRHVDIVGGSRNSLGSLRQYIADFNATKTVAAWGAQAHGRGNDARGSLPGLYCLEKNKDGSPKHPLYIPSASDLKRWNFDSGHAETPI